MLVDVLKRYLLIVWNFFFGQVSSESIQDSPFCPNDQPTDSTGIVQPVEKDSNEDILNEDLDDEIFDDEEEEDEEEEKEDEDDNKGVTSPKKQEESKIPAEVKAPELPKTKDNVEIKKPELPKVNDVEVKEKEKPKSENDETEKKKDVDVKKTETPKLKPEVEFIEGEASKDTSKKDNVKSKFEFEIIERESVVGVVPEKDQAKSKPEAEEKALSKKDEEKHPADEKMKKQQDEILVPSITDDYLPQKGPEGIAGSGAGGPATSTGTTILKPSNVDVKSAQRESNDHFVVQEKGEAETAADKVDGLKKTDDAIDSFLLGEQTHSGRLLTHPESIQDQQLDYSDSGEELSDDDIEIDYEDDEEEEEDEEEVEEVKPLPPVARSVYKKND